MYNNDRLFGFLSLVAILVFLVIGVLWLENSIGRDYTILVIFSLVGILIFAGGGLFAYSIQRVTLDAVARFNATDSQIDRYRQQTFKELARGESAQLRADAQLRVIDARRVDQLAQERAKLLVDNRQQSQQFTEKDFTGWQQELYEVTNE